MNNLDDARHGPIYRHDRYWVRIQSLPFGIDEHRIQVYIQNATEGEVVLDAEHEIHLFHSDRYPGR